MPHGKILVLGAAGRTGRLLSQQLHARGEAVLAVVRDAVRGREALGRDIDLIEGDLRDSAVLAQAVQGCERIVFLAAAVGDPARGTPRDIDFGAVAALVEVLPPDTTERLVLLSSAGVTQPEHPHNCTFASVLKWKLRGEQAVRASGLRYTVVRALGLRDRPGGQQGVRIVQGDRIAFGEDIARADVAAFLADVLSPAGLVDCDAKNLVGVTCEIFNDPTVPPGTWARPAGGLVADAVHSRGVPA